jgi:flavin reductase (DIM6/NTAB) family NADH-FMN oxidoreductase RutF
MPSPQARAGLPGPALAIIESANLAFSEPSCYINTMIGADDFRKVLGHFASGVTIITTCDGDARPTGLTASAFTSVSLDPPLVLICVDHKSQSHPTIKERGCFAVNILSAHQQEISRRFASSRLDKFEGVAHAISDLKLPLIEGAIAHLECTTVSVHVEGDHTIFVGRVERARMDAGEPLLYFRGQYDRLASPSPGA